VTTLEAAQVVVEKLIAAGVRATTDAAAVNLPAVWVAAPQRVYDVNCGYTARWIVHAVSAAPAGWDHTAWAQLDALVDAIASVYPVDTAIPSTFVMGSKSYSSYLVTFEEVCQ
jgi:hypothetical protein